MSRLSDFDRWLTTPPEDRWEAPADECEIEGPPDPCPACDFVGCHGESCPLCVECVACHRWIERETAHDAHEEGCTRDLCTCDLFACPEHCSDCSAGHLPETTNTEGSHT